MQLPANVTVAIVLLGVLLVVGVYDSVALMFWGDPWTISYVVRNWSKAFPIIALLAGIVIGHIFWPVHGDSLVPPKETLRNGKGGPNAERKGTDGN